MKYISELTNKIYDTIEECEKADETFLAERAAKEETKRKQAKEKEARQAEIEAAFEALTEARKHYSELRDNFVKDYGCLRMTFDNPRKVLSSEDFFKIPLF